MTHPNERPKSWEKRPFSHHSTTVIVNMLPGEERLYQSIDAIKQTEGVDDGFTVPNEFLHTLASRRTT
jgi:hypothetical protein